MRPCANVPRAEAVKKAKGNRLRCWHSLDLMNSLALVLLMLRCRHWLRSLPRPLRLSAARQPPITYSASEWRPITAAPGDSLATGGSVRPAPRVNKHLVITRDNLTACEPIQTCLVAACHNDRDCAILPLTCLIVNELSHSALPLVRIVLL